MSTDIAVVGAGLIGKEHIRRVTTSPTCKLVAIVDPAPAGAELARQYGVPAFTDLDQLLANVRPDGIVIATPNRLHYEQGLRCVEADLPMLLEKPVADNLTAAEALAARCHERSATVLVGHHRTHSPVMRTTREVIDSGALGQVVAVAATAFWYKPDDYFEGGPWRREIGGGPILINLIHEVHNLRIMCGGVAEVQAISSDRVRGFAVEDTAGVLMRFHRGAIATILMSDAAASGRSWEHTVHEDVNFATYPDEDCYHIVGTMGSLSVPTMRLQSFASAGATVLVHPDDADPARAAPRRPPDGADGAFRCARSRRTRVPMHDR